MTREIITIETPVEKKKIVLNKWLSGRERRLVNAVVLNNQEFTIGEVQETKKFKGEIVNQMQDELIKAYVISIDGKNDDILNKILDFVDTDYDFVIAEINKLSAVKAEIVK